MHKNFYSLAFDFSCFLLLTFNQIMLIIIIVTKIKKGSEKMKIILCFAIFFIAEWLVYFGLFEKDKKRAIPMYINIKALIGIILILFLY